MKEYQEPQEHIQEYDGYVDRNGNPLTNGKGHQVVMLPNGQKGVQIPGPRIWTLSRKHIQQARREQVIDNGKDMLGSGQVSSQFRALSSTRMGAR